MAIRDDSLDRSATLWMLRKAVMKGKTKDEVAEALPVQKGSRNRTINRLITRGNWCFTSAFRMAQKLEEQGNPLQALAEVILIAKTISPEDREKEIVELNKRFPPGRRKKKRIEDNPD